MIRITIIIILVMVLTCVVLVLYTKVVILEATLAQMRQPLITLLKHHKIDYHAELLELEEDG